MKIYFAGSIRGGREDASIYKVIVDNLIKKGEVLTEHIGNESLSNQGEEGFTEKFIHDRDINWLLSADIMIAEVTSPSIGVGYEIGRAIENNIPVHVLFRATQGKKLSSMIVGQEKITIYEYSRIEEIPIIVDEIFQR